MANAVLEVIENPDASLTVATRQCPACGEAGQVVVPPEARAGWEAWKLGRGDFIQDALPELTPGAREQLVSGMHDACFDRMFPDEED